jgi:hypothetical protein
VGWFGRGALQSQYPYVSLLVARDGFAGMNCIMGILESTIPGTP